MKSSTLLSTACVLCCLALTGCDGNPGSELANAKLALAEDRLETARTIFSDVLDADPANGEATYGLSRVAERQLAWADAYALTLRAISLDPANNAYHRAALDLEIRARQWALAARRLQEVRFDDPAERLRLCAEVRLGLGEAAEALALLSPYLDQYPVLLAPAALAAYASGDSDEALALLARADDTANGSREYVLANLLLRRETSALADWVEIHPADGDLVLLLAELKLRQRDPEGARATIVDAGRLAVRRADIAITLFEALSLLEDSQGIQRHLNAMPEKSATWFAARAYGLGLLALVNNEEAAAYEQLKTASRVLPNRSRLNLTLGLLANAAGDHELASEQLQKGLRRNPDNQVARFALAQSLAVLGDTTGAMLQVREVRGVAPGMPGLRELEAQLLVKQGYLREAWDRLAENESTQQAPTASRLLQARLAMDRGDFKRSLAVSRALVEAGTEEASAYDVYLRSLVALGRLEEALSFSRRGDDDLLRRLHAQLLLQSGRPRAALVWLEGHDDPQDRLLMAAAHFRLDEAAPIREIASKASDFILITASANYLARLGDCSAALPAWKRADSIAPDRPAVLNGMAHCMVETGDPLAATSGLGMARRAHLAVPESETYFKTLQQTRKLRGES